MMKGLILFFLPFLAFGQSEVFPAVILSQSNSVASVTNTYILAEDYDPPLGSVWTDNTANISATGNDGSAPVNTETSRLAEYTTPYLEAGDYVIWLSMTAGTFNTVFVAMNGSNDTYLAANTSSDYDWSSEYINSTGNDLTSVDGLLRYTLAEGVHTIQIYHREAVTFEQIYITKDGDTPP